MRHPHILVAFSNAILMAQSVLTLNSKNFELEENLDRQKLVTYLSSVLCSIELRNANIYFELKSAGTFLNDIVAKSSRCVHHPTYTIIT